jgi:hypothetical protein
MQTAVVAPAQVQTCCGPQGMAVVLALAHWPSAPSQPAVTENSHTIVLGQSAEVAQYDAGG